MPNGERRPKIRDITAKLEEIAPPALAEAWDNVGLLVGDPEAEPAWVAVALDAGHALAGAVDGSGEGSSAAGPCPGRLAQGPGLLITHHPTPFRPLDRVLASDPTGRVVTDLLRRQVALYAAHTNFDLAPGGLSHILALDLGLDPSGLSPLVPAGRPAGAAAGRDRGRDAGTDGGPAGGFFKLVVFVPATHTAAVRMALAEAGAGWIGNYSYTAFAAPGRGYFRPGEGARPFIGVEGQVEEVAEDRLETIVPAHALRAVIRRMLAVHPYEEAAYDVYPLASCPPVTRPELMVGLGRIGRLASGETSLGDYRETVERALGLGAGRARLLGRVQARGGSPGEREVRTVAVCPGAGGGCVRRAAAAGADVFVTGDLTYHQVVEAAELGLALIDAGHYGTEKAFTRTVAAFLADSFAGQGISLAVSEVPIPSGWLL